MLSGKTPDFWVDDQIAFEVASVHEVAATKEKKIDTDEGRYRYSRRLGTVEPVFADINHATGLRRFSLRGRRKVNAQWMMYCLAHNIGKIQRYGDIGRWKKERKVEIRQ